MGHYRELADAGWQCFLEQLRPGRTITSICEKLGIDRSTPYRKRDRDAQFATEWDMAERVCVELLGDMVVKAAMHPETVEKFDADGNLVERTVRPPNLYHATASWNAATLTGSLLPKYRTISVE